MDLLRSLETDGPRADGSPPECSRRGCRAPAGWQILWNNPKIHHAERRKIWLACDDHRDWLEHFLRQRLFWRDTEPLGDGRDADGGDAAAGESGPR
ncbi:MAG: acetone carboxylase [Nesterenkonia sp.]|uniref:acetone carboxylase n=1 Tax=Nesterenkonia marinintestina TaxID=2979865 RepID=UPI0021BFA798|nr:acetone carboxylase [Nesterenkonia sp. GX14115]MDO5492522.1 acetone carboxylase [Nesterenkonia sp.]